MKVFMSCFLLISTVMYSFAQTHSHAGERAIDFPNIEGYQTIKTDLHIHTVFSDGDVWPTIRVQEALKDGLDAIAMTDHIEYQPHKNDIPHDDRNRSYDIALEEAKNHDLLIIRGSEITRSEPIGHNNAVFLTDANALLVDDAADAFKAANTQGAFVFWNHPAWTAQSKKGLPIFSEFQQKRIAENQLHGIEVINYIDYAEEALALALEHNLTIMGTSDVHGLIDWDYIEKNKTRPVTLVFAKEKSLASIKEALFDGRTVAAYTDLLVGRAEYLDPLLESCIVINRVQYDGQSNVLDVEMENVSSSHLTLQNKMAFTFYNEPPVFTLPAKEKMTIKIKTLDRIENLDLLLEVLNAYTAPKVHPIVKLPITVSKEK